MPFRASLLAELSARSALSNAVVVIPICQLKRLLSKVALEASALWNVTLPFTSAATHLGTLAKRGRVGSPR